MPYAVTFNFKKKRYASADRFEKKNQAKYLKDALIGLNPRIVPTKDMESCPAGFTKEKEGRCVR